MNARMRNAYERYKNSDLLNLWYAYDSFSPAKAQAWEYCKSLCHEKNGHGLKVVGANTMQFSAGFEYEEDGKRMFAYITRDYDTFDEVEE